MRFFIGIVLIVICTGCDYKKRAYDTVYIRLKDDITTLDPAFIVDVDGGMVAAYLYNGLVKLDPALDVRPDIASSWEIENDGILYRFHIRDDVRFTNGRHLKAQDVKKSFERLIDPKVGSPRSWIFDNVMGKQEFEQGKADSVSGFKIVDDYTLEIILKEPFAPFIKLLTMPNTMIADVIDGNPIGTGPFVLEDWARGDSLLMKKSNIYFDGVPHVEFIKFRFIPEDFTAITEFENGKIDILEVPRAEFEYFTKDPKWKNFIYSTAMLNTYYIGFNCQKAPFSDGAIRNKIGNAINKQELVSKFLQNRVTVAQTPVPPGLTDFQAKPYHKQSKISDQFNISLYFSTDKEMEGVAELIQHDLTQAGFYVELHQLEWTALKEKIARGEADMFILSWWADYPDIENFLFPIFYSGNIGSAGNRVRYSNKEFDAVIEQARVTVDQAQRDMLYRRALEIIVNDSPWIPLWHKNKYVVTQPWIKNFYLAPVHSVDKGTDLKLEFKES